MKAVLEYTVALSGTLLITTALTVFFTGGMILEPAKIGWFGWVMLALLYITVISLVIEHVYDTRKNVQTRGNYFKNQ